MLDVAPTPPLEETLKSMGSRVLGFRRRLETNALSARDREVLNLARAVKEARAQGVSMRALAAQLKLSPQALSAFTTKGMCRAALLYLDSIDTGDDDKARARREREEQGMWDALRPRALSFMQDALAQHEETDPETEERVVVWTNPAMAQWASEKIIKGAGWDQPKVGTARAIKLDIHFVEAQSADIEGDDEITERAAAPRTVTLTPEQYHDVEVVEDDEAE